MPIHNFSAGPAMLPTEVRERLAEALAPSPDGAPSIAEVSHRGPRFTAVAEELHQRLRDLTGIGEEHAVLLLHGGANCQFAQLPMNLAADRTAAFLISGHWSKKALAEAERVTRTQVVGSSEESGFTDLPEMGHLPGDCAYLHYTGNETIHGCSSSSRPGLVCRWPLTCPRSSCRGRIPIGTSPLAMRALRRTSALQG